MKRIVCSCTAALAVPVALMWQVPHATAQSPKPALPAGYSAAKLSKEDDEGVRRLVGGIVTTWNTHDMAAFSGLLREDVEWVNVVGMHWRGREAVVKAHAVFHEIMFKDCRLKADEIEARPIGGGVAVAVVTFTQDAFTTPDGHAMPKGQTRLTLVLGKVKDEWKIVHAENVRVDAEAVRNDPVNAGRR